MTQRRQQPRERQHEESGQWNDNNKKKHHGFIFMPGEDQGVAPVLAPGQLGKVRRKG